MWNKLSMKDRAEYIRLGVASGITSLDEIKSVYNKYAEGGDLDEGGYTKESINERKAIHKRYDPTGGLGPITQGLYMLSGGNQSRGEENEYWKAYLGLNNVVPK